MSFAELKEQVAALPPKKRSQLAAFIAELQELNSPAFRAEISRRMKAMDAGRKVTQEEFEARHEELKSKGR